jgi:transcription antitermination factor NusG
MQNGHEKKNTLKKSNVRFLKIDEVAVNQENNISSLASFFLYLKNTGRLNDASMTEKSLRSLKKHLEGKEPGFEDLTEPIIRSWVDSLLPRLTIATIIRYIESLGQINKHAIRLGYIDRNYIFENIREYIDGLSEGGFDKVSKTLVEVVQKLSRVQRTDPPTVGYAIDAYLYSFYHAGLDIDAVIELQDDSQLCQMPQTAALKAKYFDPRRKYIFPLDQWKRTTKQIKLSIEKDLQHYIRTKEMKVGGRTNAEFITNAWVAAAKTCGISNADICACCPQVMGNPKLKGVEPSDLNQTQIDEIKSKVANVIIDMVPHWYAIRFIGKDDLVRKSIKEICDTTPYTIYYPIEEVYKKIKKKRVVESRPTIRNIMFIQTTANLINRIESAKIEQRSFHVLRNQARTNKEFAIIPNKEMRMFSMIVSNGMDIIGEEELQDVEIIEGSYVEITAGLNKGYKGNVYKIRNKDNSKATILEIEASLCPNLNAVLNKFFITISPEFVKCLNVIPNATAK